MRLQVKYDRSVEALLRAAATDADAALANLTGTGVGVGVRQAQVMASATAIRHALGTLWIGVARVTGAGMEESRALALDTSFAWDERLLRLAMTREARRSLHKGLLSAGQFGVEAALERLTGSYYPLSEKVYKSAALSDGWLNRMIDSALARGATYDELRKEVRQFIKPNAPGGVAYAAKRLARTEINNAYHAVTIAHNADKPWNEAMVWSLSRSHPTLDICDERARFDAHGLGPGCFPIDEVPGKAHPLCLCYVYPKTVSEEEFARNYRAGRYDAYIKATYGR